MKKTLIALALAALPVAAMADVTLYGQIKGGVASSFMNKGEGTLTQLEDYGSRIGFKGEEDLGNNIKAIWQVEQKISLAGGKEAGGALAGGWNTRDTFIGLETGFGKIRAGYISEQFNENMGTVDPWEYSVDVDNGGFTKGLGILTRNDGRLQGIRYDSPNFGGFDFNITHQLADSAVNSYGIADDKSTNHQATVLGLNYKNAGWFAQLGYGLYKHKYANTNGNLKDGQQVRVEAGYDANNWFVGLAYQYTKGRPLGQWITDGVSFVDDNNKPIVFNVKTNEVALTAAYTMGALTPRVSYAHGFKLKDVNDGGTYDNSGYDQVVLGADYALSKRTTALLSAGWVKRPGNLNYGKNDDTSVKDDFYSVGLGVKHVF